MEWYSTIILPTGDINNNGIVNVQDLGFLLSEFNKGNVSVSF